MQSRFDQPPRHCGRAFLRGLMGRCPHCGEGRMFRKFLKVVDHCEVCGEALHHHRADDAPAYFVIVIVGHIVAPLALSLEMNYAPSYWVHVALWTPLTLALSIGLLQPIKGAIVSWQWANRMHGFDGEIDSEATDGSADVGSMR